MNFIIQSDKGAGGQKTKNLRTSYLEAPRGLFSVEQTVDLIPGTNCSGSTQVST